jgi:hypothetical protein
MKMQTQWHQHVETWHESGLSLAAYCRQQSLNPKTFSAWTRRVRRELFVDKDAPLHVMRVQVAPSASHATAQASVVLRFAYGAQLELSTAAPPCWLAELLRCLA